jgi:hypothetical protein
MHYSPLLAPVVALVAWTLVVMVWMAVTRLPAMKKAGIDVSKVVGGRGQNLEGVIPDEVQWKAHNYAHLCEQPTLFYAIVLVLALMGMEQPINVYLAWSYVIIRIVHSLVQATINKVSMRFPLFLLSSLCLVGLTTHAGFRILHDCLGW